MNVLARSAAQETVELSRWVSGVLRVHLQTAADTRTAERELSSFQNQMGTMVKAFTDALPPQRGASLV